MKRLLAFVMVCVMVCGLLVGCGNNDSQTAGDGEYPTMTLTLSTQTKEDGMISVTSRMFIDLVEKYSDGAITFDEYFNASLCSGVDQLTTIGNGVSDLGDVVTLYNPSELVLHQIAYCVPFVSSDPKAVTDVFTKLTEKYPEFEAEANNAGVHILFYKGIEDYSVFGTKAMETIQDLKGESVLVGGVYYSPWFQALDCIPISESIANGYTSFKNNVASFGMSSPSSWDEYSIYEVAKYWSKTELGARACHAFAINNDVWEGLEPSVQELFEKVAAEVYAEYHDVWLPEKMEQWEANLLDSGMIVNEFSAEEKTAWVEKIMDSNDTIQMWIDQADAAGYDGAAIMSEYLKITQESGYEFPYDVSKYIL